jgi:hypothetical protein
MSNAAYSMHALSSAEEFALDDSEPFQRGGDYSNIQSVYCGLLASGKQCFILFKKNKQNLI